MPQSTFSSSSPSSSPSAERAALAGVLLRVWGFQDFLPLQAEAMEAVCERRDSVLVLPTGGGKSVCFQAPILTEGQGLAVVVSPLISLMKDQVDSLVGNGVEAAFYNSAQTLEERDAISRELRQGRYRLLYVSPERLAGEAGPRFVDLLRHCDVRYLAVDEAHCISQWGHDFRPEYRQLGQLRDRLPGISIHAYTATATQRVRQDIAEQLGLQEPRMLVGSFDRPNLVYRALRRNQARSQLRRIVERHRGEAGIVYCISRKEVERVAEGLRGEGLTALPYHAGLDDEVRRRNQDAFINERAEVVVATVAFGMGIDRSNVRYVVHLGAPKSLEHYQQEAGRAGRDGLEAECTLIYSPADFLTWRRMLERSGELGDAAQSHLREMERYAAQTRCRHRALVEYFGQDFEKEDCGACDWCLGELEAAEDATLLAQKILSGVARLRQGFGVGHLTDVLRGRLTEKVRIRAHHELSTFGLLEDLSVAELRGYVDQLVDQGFLLLAGDRYPLLRLTAAGVELMKGQRDCALYRQRRPQRAAKRRKGPTGESWEGVARDLFEHLRRVRLELARQRGVPPYVIFHDSVLRHLARLQPTDRRGLLEVPGVGEKKADDLGPSFLEAIASFAGGEPVGSDEDGDDPGAGRPELD